MKKRTLCAALCLALCAMATIAALGDGAAVPDGFRFSGGSGRVTIRCPKLAIEGDRVMATLEFSSPHYTRLVVDGKSYDASHEGDTSVFEVPVRPNEDMTVVATTTAMSTPHDIEYTICVLVGKDEAGAEGPDADGSVAPEAAVVGSLRERDPKLPGLTWQRELPLRYAEQFAVDYYEGGYKLLTISDGARYLVIPEGSEVPKGVDAEVRVVRQPLGKIYVAATAAMALLDELDVLDAVRLSGTRAEGWYVEGAAQAMRRGDMLYAGKYSEPDYELLLDEGCDLAVESTMILHAPKVREMLEQLGIPVLVERSSFERHPLGRTEWIKLYAALLDREREAETFFDGQAAMAEALEAFPNTEETVVFFYISTDGSVVVRGAGDYVARMIELAGGRYVFSDPTSLNGTGSSVTISMEDFYAAAVDADFLIYNGSIDAPPHDLGELLAKSELLADFRAVRDGNVWTTDRYLYQATDIVGELIVDINRMLTGRADGMTFLRRLE